MTTLLQTSPDVLYPETDGLPLADNTIQFRLITTTQGGIDALFRHEQVFVAGDLLWYPLEHNPDEEKSKAPDIMVVFGRNKGDRRSYKQWKEDNIAPQVVFEFVSHNNSKEEVEVKKFRFYQKHGVEEYYVYDPDRGTLKGWFRQNNRFQAIEPMQGWVSPRLGIRFELVGKELQLYFPNGERFATYPEIIEQRQQAERERDRERQLREQAEQLREQEQQLREQAEQRAERLAEQLRALNIDPDALG